MSHTLVIIIFALLGILVFLLAAYLGILLAKLNQQKKHSSHIEELMEAANLEQEEFYLESLSIIAKATLQDQCETSEACIRIKKILEFFPEIESSPGLEPIQTMYKDLENFAYLDERNELAKQEKFKQDNQRFKVEEKYEKDFKAALKILLDLIKTKH